MSEIEGAKLIGGLWLPASEEHFVEMMAPGAKRHRVVDGRWTYQLHKIEGFLAKVPGGRRRRCIDAGAHAGLWAVHLRKEFAAVEAFEPVPLHRACFAANVTGANVTLHAYALGAEAGSAAMHVPEDTTGNAHIATEEVLSNGRGPIRLEKGIAVRSLDSFGFAEVDLIKIDVEGYELPVVEGAAETLLRERPFVVVEQKGNDARFYGQARDSALSFLADLGMRRRDVISGDHLLGW